MNRTGLCLLACGLNLPLQLYAGEQVKNEKMNVLFFLVDDLRWNSLHCMGTNFLITPNIDNLATNGVLFKNAYVTTGISCVSRATLLTGQYMARHHITGFGKAIPEKNFVDTYPAQMRKHGYWTGHVGKYGIGRIRPSDYDFSSIYEGVHWYPTDPNVKIQKLGGGYTHIEGDSIHVTERNVQDALRFLHKRPKDKPFCLSLSFYATHAEDNHPDQYRYQPSSSQYYKDVTIPVPFTAKDKYLKRLPTFLQAPENEGRIRWHWRFDTPEKYQHMMKSYYRLLTEVDEGIGRVVKELKKEGAYENTLIVFMGDNGYFHSEHQLADKWYPYQEAMRVPLIIYDPRVPKAERGMKESKFALNIDIAPTLLSAVSIPVPKVMQGKDLSQLYLKHNEKNWRKDFYYEHPIISNARRIPSSEALMTGDMKYIYWPDYKTEELFNLKKDPYEINNRIKDSSYQRTLKAMKSRFEQLKKLAQ